jgi:phosphoenolpyruvate carboxykinase (ATP)
MANIMGTPSRYGLDHHGLQNLNMEYWTLSTSALIERVVSRREGVLAHEGAVVVRTGNQTGRAANDKFIVKDEDTDGKVWWGKINRAIDPIYFERLYLRMNAYFQGRDIFVQDTSVCADPQYRMPIRVITENAWHSLFARNLFLRMPIDQLENHIPQFTILQAPGFRAIPEVDGTNSDIFVVLNFSKKMVLIGGTSYAGEVKKSIFTIMNYLLPPQGVLSMHCSANVGNQGDVALFFGLSGTGKTTLSSDVDRGMIGDDEHGWGEEGIFNFEGGCYAKVIKLSKEWEPLIWGATRRFGTILENVNIDTYTRRINFDDASYTENSRAAYPIGFLPNSLPSGRGIHPKTIFFLTADASGTIPPIAKLTTNQALYYFLSGYTSKLAGTEKDLGKEPQITFSTCFGAPFMPLNPNTYAQLLGEKLRTHNTQVWLINTGWSGGPYGVGSRIPLPFTRAMVSAALSGELNNIPMRIDPYFGLSVPTACPEVPDQLLDPQASYFNTDEYHRRTSALVVRFQENFTQFSGSVTKQVNESGPKLRA